MFRGFRAFGGLVVLLAALPAAREAVAADALGPARLGVVINSNDPLSERIGAYYAQRRGIPAANVVRVRLPVNGVASKPEFEAAYAEMNPRLPADVQALALAWMLPYRAGCMSITAAFAMGYDEATCVEGCKPTPVSRYFDSDTREPYTDVRIRPAMSLAASSFEDAKALIDRGIAADGTAPRGTAYLLSTTDPTRNVRAASYPFAVREARPGVKAQVIGGDLLFDKHDVMFYFTGLVYVVGLRTNTYLPGAITRAAVHRAAARVGRSRARVHRVCRARGNARLDTQAPRPHDSGSAPRRGALHRCDTARGRPASRRCGEHLQDAAEIHLCEDGLSRSHGPRASARGADALISPDHPSAIVGRRP